MHTNEEIKMLHDAINTTLKVVEHLFEQWLVVEPQEGEQS